MKTKALRILDQNKVPYSVKEYPVIDGKSDALSVAEFLEMEPERIFKTLIARGRPTGPIVFCIPGSGILNLKTAAKISGNKKVEMLPLKELLPLTGYIHGGCSPLGIKNNFPVFVDESVFHFDKISVSAGVRGVQMILSPEDLIKLTEAQTASLCT